MISKKLDLHTSQNYLKAILESIALYNANARADLSNWLYEGYKEAGNNEKKQISKKTIILELLSKWIEIWEDIVVLALMFGDTGITKKDKLPFEIYANYHTQEVARFLYKAKNGLSDDILSKIYAIKPANQMLKENIITNKEYAYSKKWIKEKIREKGKKTFYNMAREFIKRKRRNKNTIDYSFLINVYFNTKHGFKIFQETETSKKLWDFNNNDIVLFDKIKKIGKRKLMIAGIFKKFSDDDVKLLINRINGWSQVTKEIALAQLEYLKNPNWIISEIRISKTKQILESGIKKPGRNNKCLCDSDIKFKKCCGRFI